MVEIKLTCFSEEPETDIDERCYRANGFFNHLEETECSKFYNCVDGKVTIRSGH